MLRAMNDRMMKNEENLLLIRWLIIQILEQRQKKSNL